MKYAMCAASQVPFKGPTDEDDAPCTCMLMKNLIIIFFSNIYPIWGGNEYSRTPDQDFRCLPYQPVGKIKNKQQHGDSKLATCLFVTSL